MRVPVGEQEQGAGLCGAAVAHRAVLRVAAEVLARLGRSLAGEVQFPFEVYLRLNFWLQGGRVNLCIQISNDCVKLVVCHCL